jgi:hypothetical protein
MSHCPLSVALAIAVDLANLLVSAQKCWCGVMFGICSVGGTVLWNLRFDMPESWKCSTGHIGSGPLMDPGTIRQHCAMPKII